MQIAQVFNRLIFLTFFPLFIYIALTKAVKSRKKIAFWLIYCILSLFYGLRLDFKVKYSTFRDHLAHSQPARFARHPHNLKSGKNGVSSGPFQVLYLYTFRRTGPAILQKIRHFRKWWPIQKL